MVKKIREALGGSEAGKTIAVLGLTFKPETDDMRDAPSLAILPNLIDKGVVIHAHDPQGMEEAKKQLPGEVRYFSDVYEAIEGELYVTPAPSLRHQRIAKRLTLALHRLLEEPGHGEQCEEDCRDQDHPSADRRFRPSALFFHRSLSFNARRISQ